MKYEYSSLHQYYKEAGKYSLLSREEENELGGQVRKGGKAAKLAVDKLIESNLRLVIKIAQDFQGRGLDFQDLISEGNMGLCTAAKKFDPTKGAKFSYYSSFWIKQSLFRAVANQARLIRMPVHALDKYFKIVAYMKKYEKKHGEKPNKRRVAKRFSLSLKRVSEILKASEAIVPLDASTGLEGGAKIHDVIPDASMTPYESIGQTDDCLTLEGLVDKLPKREGFIIRSRFGLGGKDRRTLEELGKKLKITRERVRQLQTKALTRLKFLTKGKVEV